jgi:hypothetical protein
MSNSKAITLGDKTLLYSYDTLVAVHVTGEGYYRTSEHYSSTTSRHINKFLDGANSKFVKSVTPAELFELTGRNTAPSTVTLVEVALKCPKCASTKIEYSLDDNRDYENGDEGYWEELICKDCNAEIIAEYSAVLTSVRLAT